MTILRVDRTSGDLSVRYEVIKNLYVDVDVSLANPRATGVPKTGSYLPLAPRLSSVGGFTYRKFRGLNGSLRYRFIGDRPANEDNTVVAKEYFVADAGINYTMKRWEAGIAIQNLFDVRWKETQLDTESRLRTNQHRYQKFILHLVHHFLHGQVLLYISKMNQVVKMKRHLSSFFM